MGSMPLTEREEILLTSLKEWENQLLNHETSDIEHTYNQWLESTMEKLPVDIKEKIQASIDQWLFYIHASIQHTSVQKKSIKRLLNKVRLIYPEIENIPSLKQLPIDVLNVYADEQIQRHQLIGMFQGALAGTGRFLFVSTDILSMIVINVRAIQLIAAAYGFDIQRPFEQMLSLKVFYVATLPKRFQKEAWNDLWNELEENDQYYYYGEEDVTGKMFIHFPLRQIIKSLAILTFKNKEKPSFISMAIGASSNYYSTKNITEFAQKFYQYRLLKEKIE